MLPKSFHHPCSIDLLSTPISTPIDGGVAAARTLADTTVDTSSHSNGIITDSLSVGPASPEASDASPSPPKKKAKTIPKKTPELGSRQPIPRKSKENALDSLASNKSGLYGKSASTKNTNKSTSSSKKAGESTKKKGSPKKSSSEKEPCARQDPLADVDAECNGDDGGDAGGHRDRDVDQDALDKDCDSLATVNVLLSIDRIECGSDWHRFVPTFVRVMGFPEDKATEYVEVFCEELEQSPVSPLAFWDLSELC